MCDHIEIHLSHLGNVHKWRPLIFSTINSSTCTHISFFFYKMDVPSTHPIPFYRRHFCTFSINWYVMQKRKDGKLTSSRCLNIRTNKDFNNLFAYRWLWCKYIRRNCSIQIGHNVVCVVIGWKSFNFFAMRV